MASDEPISDDPRIIKRYSNRKLYDTRESRYVTLQQIGEMVRRGEDVQIIDNKTKEDKTEVTLALIISEDLKSKPRSVSVGTLRNLIQERGEKMLSTLREGPLGRLIPGGEDGEGAAEGEEGEQPAQPAEAQGATPDAVKSDATGDGAAAIQQLRAEVDALRARVDELEKKLAAQ